MKVVVNDLDQIYFKPEKDSDIEVLESLIESISNEKYLHYGDFIYGDNNDDLLGEGYRLCFDKKSWEMIENGTPTK